MAADLVTVLIAILWLISFSSAKEIKSWALSSSGSPANIFFQHEIMNHDVRNPIGIPERRVAQVSGVKLSDVMYQDMHRSLATDSIASTVFNATVAVDGTEDFSSINDAIEKAPVMSSQPFTIHIKKGTYHEYVVVPQNKTNIILVGDGPGTIITGNKSNKKGYKTHDSATVVARGSGFIAKYMTFQNSAHWSEGMAVAFLNEANQSAFYQCTFWGFQDTLYARKYTQFYRECDIYGTVDFIFGYAAAIFQNCRLYAHLPNGTVTFTAQNKPANHNQTSGYVIQNCTLTFPRELHHKKWEFKAFLGRPWSPYSTVVVMESWLDWFIDPKGWDQWHVPLDQITYREYKNRGPRSNTTDRVKWPGFKVLNNPSDAEPYTATVFFNGDDWLPKTGIPYYGGLAEK